MTPVFGHGRLRLYLLVLLAEQPRHGYEIIQLLKERFAGLYSPSAGTIYPRLARLEAEGLIRHEIAGGRKNYLITDAGRAELAAKADELADLETEIHNSARELAEGIRAEVRETARAVQDDLARAARSAQRTRESARSTPPEWPLPPDQEWTKSQRRDAKRAWKQQWAEQWREEMRQQRAPLDRFGAQLRELGELVRRQNRLTESQARQARDIIERALADLRAVFETKF